MTIQEVTRTVYVDSAGTEHLTREAAEQSEAKIALLADIDVVEELLREHGGAHYDFSTFSAADGLLENAEVLLPIFARHAENKGKSA